jgi:hypothetical protein
VGHTAARDSVLGLREREEDKVTTLVFLIGMFLQQRQHAQMVAPTVTHHEEKSVQTYDRVEITCPAGYEGHYVDQPIGFDGSAGGPYGFWMNGSGGGSGPPAYMICFSNEFMEQIRKNPELLRARPVEKAI